MLLLYAVVKFVAYSGWCYLGLSLIYPGAARVTFAMKLGALRWLLGLLFGIAAFMFMGSISSDAVAKTYVLLYTPLRAIEWTIMVIFIWRTTRVERLVPSYRLVALWIAGGMLLSFVTDLASPEGLSGKFCVGRCLC